MAVEVFQSRAKWRTDRPTHREENPTYHLKGVVGEFSVSRSTDNFSQSLNNVVSVDVLAVCGKVDCIINTLQVEQ